MSIVVTKKKSLTRKSAATSAEWNLRRAGRLQFLESPALARLGWLVHGFSTRPGGVSELSGARVLNLGFADWDSRDRVRENRQKFLAAIGAD